MSLLTSAATKWRGAFVSGRICNQPFGGIRAIGFVFSLNPFGVRIAGRRFAGKSEPAFRRALQVGLKQIGSDFHTIPDYSLDWCNAAHSPHMIRFPNFVPYATKFRLGGFLFPTHELGSPGDMRTFASGEAKFRHGGFEVKRLQPESFALLRSGSVCYRFGVRANRPTDDTPAKWTA